MVSGLPGGWDVSTFFQMSVETNVQGAVNILQSSTADAAVKGVSSVTAYATVEILAVKKRA